MKIKRSTGSVIFDTFNICFMLALILVTLYPFMHVAFASISDPRAISVHQGPIFFPQGFGVGNYALVLKNPMIRIGFSNTVKYLLIGTTINVLMTIFCAYGLSRKDMYWRKPLMMFVLFTMYFSGGLIPSYLLIVELGLINSLWAVILPGAMSTYNMIIMRTSLAAVPDSMEESARLDGANDIIILFRILLPLCIPTLAVMVLFYAVGHWNAWFSAMLYFDKKELYPIQLVLREILIINNTGNDMMTGVSNIDVVPVAETVKYATIMIATVPILIVYPFLQKYFVKGMMIGAVKG